MSLRERLASSCARLGDAVNPIVVKEARQAVRSRALLGGVFLLIGALVLISMGMTIFGNVREEVLAEQGAELFSVINAVLIFFGVAITPVYIGVRFAGERTGSTADLMHTTTLRPSSIVLGKLTVAGMLAILLVSIAAPFLALTYLLRGIDLPTIGFYVGFDLFIIFFASMIGVFVAALPVSMIFKSLIGLAALPVMLWMTTAFATIFIGFGGFSVTSFGSDAWIALGITAGLAFATAGALVCIAIAISAPKSSDRARLPRLYITLLWIATFGLVYWIENSTHFYSSGESPLIWLRVWVVTGTFALVLSTAERRTINPRLRRSTPKNRILRPLAYLFTTGAAPGFLWAATMVVLTFAVFYLIYPGGGLGAYPQFAQGLQDLMFVPLWLCVYSLAAVFLRDRVLTRWVPPHATPMLVFMLTAIGSLVPFLIAYFRDPRYWDRQDWPLALNPFGFILTGHSIEFRNTMLTIVLSALAFFVILNAGWFLRQIRMYRPLDQAKRTHE